LAFSQCSTSIYQAFDGQTECSRVFNFVTYLTRKIRKNLMHTEICALQYASASRH